MATKLTKAFAEFVGGRRFAGGFWATGLTKRVLLPFLTKLAVEVNAKKRSFEFHVPNAEDRGPEINSTVDNDTLMFEYGH